VISQEGSGVSVALHPITSSLERNPRLFIFFQALNFLVENFGLLTAGNTSTSAFIRKPEAATAV
jgi:hypothetical protein